MKLLTAISSLALVIGCAFGAALGHQSLVFKHFGGKKGELIHGKRLVFESPNSDLSTVANLELAKTGTGVEPLVWGNAAVAVAREGKEIDYWISVGDQTKHELKVGSAVLLIVGNDAADMEDIFEFGNKAFTDGKIQQGVVDSNEFFSIAAYKILLEDESQPGNSGRPIKSTNDVVPISHPSSGRNSFVLDCVGGQNGAAQLMVEPKLVQLKISGSGPEYTGGMIELDIRSSKSKISGSGMAVAHLFRDGKKAHVFYPEDGDYEWDAKVGDIALVVVRNEKAIRAAVYDSVSSAIIDGNINDEAFKVGENHTMMAFKVNHSDRSLHDRQEKPVKVLNGDELKVTPQNGGSFVLEPIDTQFDGKELVAGPDYAILTHSDHSGNSSTAKLVLKTFNSDLFLSGRVLIYLVRKGILKEVFCSEEPLNATLNVEVDDLIRFVSWEQDMKLSAVLEWFLRAAENGEIDDKSLKIASFRVAFEGEQQNKKRKREEEESLAPIKRHATIPVSLQIEERSNNFPNFKCLNSLTFKVATTTDDNSQNSVKIEILKGNKMRAHLTNNAYLLVIRDGIIINRILPSKFFDIIDLLQKGDRISVFIHEHKLGPNTMKIVTGKPFFPGVSKWLLTAGYAHLSLKVE